MHFGNAAKPSSRTFRSVIFIRNVMNSKLQEMGLTRRSLVHRQSRMARTKVGFAKGAAVDRPAPWPRGRTWWHSILT